MTEKIFETPKGPIHYWLSQPFAPDTVHKILEPLKDKVLGF